eukprot:scaffold237_cov421-Prasinococcus_capsulatus_cf.AAC.20
MSSDSLGLRRKLQAGLDATQPLQAAAHAAGRWCSEGAAARQIEAGAPARWRLPGGGGEPTSDRHAPSAVPGGGAGRLSVAIIHPSVHPSSRESRAQGEGSHASRGWGWDRAHDECSSVLRRSARVHVHGLRRLRTRNERAPGAERFSGGRRGRPGRRRIGAAGAHVWPWAPPRERRLRPPTPRAGPTRG